MQVGDLMVKIGLDMGNIQAQMQKLETQFQNLHAKMERASEGSFAVAGGLMAVGAAGAGAVGFGGMVAADMEQAQISFKVMLGSADKAKTMLADLTKFAANTPFEFPEIQNSAKSLLAFGVAAGDIPNTLTKLGDIASGVGVPLTDLSEIFGKAKTSGRLFAEDINQLTGRGIPIIQELAKQFGVSESKVKDLVEQGKVGFPELDKAFSSMTAKGSKFGGMMAEQSESTKGLWSTLSDTFNMGLAGISQKLMTTFDIKVLMKGAIDSMGQFFDSVNKIGFLGTIGGLLEKAFGPNTVAILSIAAGALAGALVPALWATATGLWATLAPLAPFIAAGAALGAIAYTIYKNWDVVGPAFMMVADKVKNVLVPVFNWAKATIQNVLGVIQNMVGFWMDVFRGNWDGAWNHLKAAFSGTWKIVTDTVSGAIKVISNLVSGISDIGMNIIKGLWNGMISLGTWLANKVQNFVSENVVQPIKSYLGIQSPSRLMAEYGGYVSEGFAKGIDDGGDKVQTAAQKLAAKAAAKVQALADAIQGAVDKVGGGLSLNMQLAEARFNLFKAQMGENATQAQLYGAEMTMLSDKIAAQKDTVALLQQAYKDMVAVKGKNSEESIKLQLQLINEKTALVNLTAEQKKYNDEAQKAADLKAKIAMPSAGASASDWENYYTQVAIDTAYKSGGTIGSNGSGLTINGQPLGSQFGPETGGNSDGGTGKPVWLATGAVVTKPTLAMVGEAGKEAVIPLDRLDSMVGGGNHAEINIYGTYDVNTLGEELVRVLRRKGVFA